MPDVNLTLGSGIYGGWTTVRVVRSLEALAGSFEISLTEREPGAVRPRTFTTGEQCTVQLDGETVITGYVDDVAPSYDAEQHTIRIAGRDRTADLVDCSAIHKPGEWRAQTLDVIVAELARPFGISVRILTDTGKPFARFAIEQGETVFEAIDRLCRMRGVLATSTPGGTLVVMRATGGARVPVTLEKGVNVISAAGRASQRERFSQYIVKGQHPGDDLWPTEMAAHLRGTATDAGVGRYRPLLVIAEDLTTTSSAGDRAAWEANVRSARSRRPSYTVQGWRTADGGPLWAPGQTVRVVDDWIGLDRDMLVTGVQLDRSDAGTTTTLDLAIPGAFDRIVEPEGPAGWL